METHKQRAKWLIDSKTYSECAALADDVIPHSWHADFGAEEPGVMKALGDMLASRRKEITRTSPVIEGRIVKATPTGVMGVGSVLPAVVVDLACVTAMEWSPEMFTPAASVHSRASAVFLLHASQVRVIAEHKDFVALTAAWMEVRNGQ